MLLARGSCARLGLMWMLVMCFTGFIAILWPRGDALFEDSVAATAQKDRRAESTARRRTYLACYGVTFWPGADARRWRRCGVAGATRAPCESFWLAW